MRHLYHERFESKKLNTNLYEIKKSDHFREYHTINDTNEKTLN